jgi:hypothetical protein
MYLIIKECTANKKKCKSNFILKLTFKNEINTD